MARFVLKILITVLALLGVLGMFLVIWIYPNANQWPDGWIIVYLIFWTTLGLGLYDLFFVSKKPDLEYWPNEGQILMRFGCPPIQIQRKDMTLRLVMNLGAPDDERIIWVCEGEEGLDESPRASKDHYGKINLSDGQVLNVTPHNEGFLIWWDGEPWKIVEQ